MQYIFKFHQLRQVFVDLRVSYPVHPKKLGITFTTTIQNDTKRTNEINSTEPLQNLPTRILFFFFVSSIERIDHD